MADDIKNEVYCFEEIGFDEVIGESQNHSIFVLPCAVIHDYGEFLAGFVWLQDV